MVSKRDIYRMIQDIIYMLRAGNTDFSRGAARKLATKLERAIVAHYPEISPSGYFMVKKDGVLVKCRFARLPHDVPYRVTKKGIYLINSRRIPEDLL